MRSLDFFSYYLLIFYVFIWSFSFSHDICYSSLNRWWNVHLMLLVLYIIWTWNGRNKSYFSLGKTKKYSGNYFHVFFFIFSSSLMDFLIVFGKYIKFSKSEKFLNKFKFLLFKFSRNVFFYFSLLLCLEDENKLRVFIKILREFCVFLDLIYLFDQRKLVEGKKLLKSYIFRHGLYRLCILYWNVENISLELQVSQACKAI